MASAVLYELGKELGGKELILQIFLCTIMGQSGYGDHMKSNYLQGP